MLKVCTFIYFTLNLAGMTDLKNPLYNVKEVIFLTTEMTILVTLLRQNRLFSLLLCRFLGPFVPD